MIDNRGISNRRVDFSGNAPIYDRRHGPTLSVDEVERLVRAAALPRGATVLDVGAGTGRIAQPLVAAGFRVFAVEPASGMLERLRIKAPGVTVIAADGAQLPFRDGVFAGIVVARLLYLAPAWTSLLDEARRVSAHGGCVLHEWGNGDADEAWVQIREKARSIFEAAGVGSPFHPGVRSNETVDAYMRTIGLVQERVVSMGAGPSMTLRDFVRRIVTGEFSYVWTVPEPVRLTCLPELERWAERTFDMDRQQPVPREIGWTIFRKIRTGAYGP